MRTHIQARKPASGLQRAPLTAGISPGHLTTPARVRQIVGGPRVPGGVLQRKCACGQHAGGGECEECSQEKQSLQRREGNGSEPAGVPPIVHEVLRSPGQPLDGDTRAFMEPRFGHDFSGVRVHTGARAAESATSVNALAYTVGQNVVFGEGQYQPGAGGGNKLLAHELTHVVQQANGNEAEILKERLAVSTPGDSAEREADSIAKEVEHEVATVPEEARVEVSASPIREFMEPRFGHDFTRLRVHTDARAADSAQAVNAIAYTIGHEIIFREGAFAPERSFGKKFLAPELTHVVQKSGGVGRQLMRRSLSDPRSNPPSLSQMLEKDPPQTKTELKTVLATIPLGDIGKVELSVGTKDLEKLVLGPDADAEEQKMFTRLKTGKLEFSGVTKLTTKYSNEVAHKDVELFQLEPGVNVTFELKLLNIEVESSVAKLDLASFVFSLKGSITAENVDLTAIGALVKSEPGLYRLIKRGLNIELSGEIKATFDAEDAKHITEILEARRDMKVLKEEAKLIEQETKMVKAEMEALEAEKKFIGTKADELIEEGRELTKSKKKLEGESSRLRNLKKKTETVTKRLEKIERTIAAQKKKIAENNAIAKRLNKKLREKVAPALKKIGSTIEDLVARKSTLQARLGRLEKVAREAESKLTGKLAKLIGKKALVTILEVIGVVGLLLEVVDALVMMLKVALNYQNVGWIWNEGIPLDEVPIKRLPDPVEGGQIADKFEPGGGGILKNGTEMPEDAPLHGGEVKELEVDPSMGRGTATSNEALVADTGLGGKGKGLDSLLEAEDQKTPEATKTGTGKTEGAGEAEIGSEADGQVQSVLDEEALLPLESSPLAKRVWGLLQVPEGVRPRNEADVESLVSMVEKYQEFVTYEEVEDFFGKPSERSSKDFSVLLSRLEEALKEIMKRRVPMAGDAKAGSGGVTTAGTDTAMSVQEESENNVKQGGKRKGVEGAQADIEELNKKTAPIVKGVDPGYGFTGGPAPVTVRIRFYKDENALLSVKGNVVNAVLVVEYAGNQEWVTGLQLEVEGVSIDERDNKKGTVVKYAVKDNFGFRIAGYPKQIGFSKGLEMTLHRDLLKWAPPQIAPGR